MYQSETQKIRPAVKQYCGIVTLDVGCGHDKIVPDALGVDHRDHEVVSLKVNEPEDMAHLSEWYPELLGQCDAIYSAHYLGFIREDFKAIRDWIKFLKVGGYMILYLPDADHFDPGQAPEKVNRYTYKSFLNWFKKHFRAMSIVECGQDIGPDRYSFFVVARRDE